MDPIRAWVRSDPVRQLVDKVVPAWKRHKGWRKVGIGTLVVILICVVLVVGLVVLLVWLVKGLSVGGVRNKELYLPGRFSNQDLYIPRSRRR